MSDDFQGTPPAPTPPPPGPAVPPPAAGGGAPDSSLRTAALLWWIFAPLGLIALALDQYKDSVWLKSHVIQAAGVWLVGAILSTITFGIGSVAALIYQIIIGIKANKGESVEVPLIYGIVKGMIGS